MLVLSIWFAYSLAFAISVAFLYYIFKTSITYVQYRPTTVTTTYFVDIRDKEAESLVALAGEKVREDPERAINLALTAVDRVLDKACEKLGLSKEGGIKEKIERLREAGLLFGPEVVRILEYKRPSEFILAVKRLLEYLREAPVVIKKKNVSNSK